LANFVAEWTKVQTPTLDITHEYWTLYFDESVMGPGAGATVVLISPKGNKLHYAICLHFQASSNVAGYDGLINGLRISIELRVTQLYACGDSKLVVDQVMKVPNCESSLMDTYCQEVCKLEGKFQGIELHHVPRRDNNDADALTKMAAQRDATPDGVFINDLYAPSIHIKPYLPQEPSDLVPGGPSQVPPDRASPDQGLGGPDYLAVEATTSTATASATDSDWRAPLLAYLLDEVLPVDQIEARRIARRAKTYVAIDAKLHKRSPSAVGMLMKCILAH
jgi:ribonuclease HI